MQIVNLVGGLTYNISNVLMANASAAWFDLDASVYRDPDEIKKGYSAHFNIIWSPVKSINAGAEFMSLGRTNGDGASGTGNRLQFMIKYLF